jgi:ABC-2 type transport system permease protein
MAVARKEVYHIWRDPFTMILALIFPLFMVMIYGYAIDFNMKDIRLAVSDSDKSQSSRGLQEDFGSSHYFRLFPAGSPVNAVAAVQGERARATLIIPPRFEKDLNAGRPAAVQILLDGADSSTVASASTYISTIQALANSRRASFSPPLPYELRTRFLFNPELNSNWFVIPGLIVVVMTILSILLTALTVSREWENGSMELLLSTPVQPLEIIIGKLSPYAVLGLFAVSMTYVLARVAFGVPFAGSLWIFGLGCLLFLITYLSQGLLISVIARNQQVAMQMSMLSGLLPSNLLSGFIFPIASMPLFFRYFTMLLPARWFMNISRGAFLRGAGFLPLSTSFFALTLFSFAMIGMATRRFKRDLEP